MRKLTVTILILLLVLTVVGCDMFDVETSLDENDKVEEELLMVDSNINKGFYWDYYLCIPETVSNNSNLNYTNYMLVEPISTPERSDDMEYFEQAAKNIADNNYYAKKLGIPVLVPIFPRPKTIDGNSYPPYIHQLDRSSLKTNIEEYKRIDEQLIAMIDHSQNLLERKNIYLKKEVFMYGFSASGVFTNRFIVLHPERIKAAAAGGISEPIIPAKEIKANNLYYSVGIYDLKKLTGKNINWEEYQNTPQFIFRGEADGNDALLALDGVEDVKLSGVELYEKVMDTEYVGENNYDPEGGKIIKERILKAVKIYEDNDIPVKTKFYEGVGHEINKDMREDVVDFFKNNSYK